MKQFSTGINQMLNFACNSKLDLENFINFKP